MKNIILLTIMTIVLLLSCSPSPKEIDYGHDMCHFCKMTIVDSQHAAQLVTSKGKVTKYDAIECMINYVNDNPEMELAFTLVNDYSKPTHLVDAQKSYYLVSQNIPSPMGEFLSAFSTKEEAMTIQKSKTGNVYNWTEIKEYMSSGLSNVD